MTVLEAITIIENEKPQCGEKLTFTEEEKCEAFDMCIDALKRNEKREPYLESDGEADGYPVYDLYECPNCGEAYNFEDEHHAYCPECGQALDWSFEEKSSAVEFVSYDGKYPNLCSGTLVLKINGETVKFPPYCLCSGGSIYDAGNDYIATEGDWVVTCFPRGYQKYADEINKCVNENVEHGCCGGCI